MSKDGGKTIEDWLTLSEDSRFELIDGEFVEKAVPFGPHAIAQRQAGGVIGAPFHRRPGGPNGPGGWWIMTEPDIILDDRGLRPDLAGWRREHLPEVPNDAPITVAPDWICEIVSASNRAHDTVTELRLHHQARVAHYWLLDPTERTLTVYRHTPEGYLLVLTAEAHERVRGEPFDAIELLVGVLLGDDPED